MSNPRSIITSQLDIELHAKEGLSLPISLEEDGVVIDISARSIKFEIQGMTAKDLAADPANALGRKLIMTLDELVAIRPGGEPRKFALVDYSGAAPVVRWEGMITRYGF